MNMSKPFRRVSNNVFFCGLSTILTHRFLSEPLPDPSKFTPREGEAQKHAKRRQNADVEAEITAVTCVAVYMLLMSFSQKGINKLRNHQEHMKMRYPDGDFIVSEGFDDGLSFWPISRSKRFLTPQ